MGWRPSTDRTLQREASNAFWAAIEPAFDRAVNPNPLPRAAFSTLTNDYVRQRKGDSRHVAELGSRLPLSFGTLSLGATDIELLDFVLNYSKGRVLKLVGPRGAGKTSLIHFAEASLRKSAPDPVPTLVIIDGLDVGQAATVADFIALIHDEFARASKDPTNSYSGAYHRALTAFDKAADLMALRRAARVLADSLPGQDSRLVTFVFDNLDQHHPAVVAEVVDLARHLFSSSQLGSIICLRPGSQGHVVRSSAASAHFTFSLNIYTPSPEAWLETVGARVARSIEEHSRSSGRPTEALGITLTPQRVESAFSRFVSLLGRRRTEDDVLQILAAVSANDTRHLIRLVRRLLQNRDLPAEWLLSDGSGDPPSFHPITALIEGSHHIFVGGMDVPNLLSFNGGTGNPEFLLLHRILTLLDSSATPVATARLFRWLSEFESYDETSVIDCLSLLASSHLIGSSDAEIISREDPLPTELFLTDAGEYYLHHLLHLADYLTMAVLDVPLEHQRLRHSDSESFAARLDSLLEYTEEVKQREERQLARLAKRPPSAELRRVADALSKGGLWTASLLDGFGDVVSRSRLARSSSVQQAVRRVEAEIQPLKRWLDFADQRLREIVNRGRRVVSATIPSVNATERDTQVRAQLSPIGDEIQIRAEVRTTQPSTSTLVAVTGQSPVPFSQAVPATPAHADVKNEGPVVLTAQFREVPASATGGDDVAFQILSVPRFLSRVGVLSVDEDGEHFNTRFYLLDDQSVRDFTLHGTGTPAEVVAWSVAALNDLSGVVTTGTSFSDRLRIVGTALAERVFSPDSIAVLASMHKLVDTLVVFSSRAEIPWELIAPPAGKPPLLPMIGDVWRVVRWTADPLLGALKLFVSDHRHAARSLITIGVDPAGSTWRHRTPADMGQLTALASTAGTLHLIGHWEGGALVPLDGGCRLDVATVKAFGLYGPSHVIVSACGAGAVEKGANLPIAISMSSGCVVWAPLVMLSEHDALTVDNALMGFVSSNPDEPVESFMRRERDNLPLLKLYVRYGLTQSQEISNG